MNRLPSMFFGIILAGFGLLLATGAKAATVTVTDAASFQAALNTASSNGEPDIINLAGTTFDASAGFAYQTVVGEDQPLSIVGATDGSTILDAGGASVQVLILQTDVNNPNADANSDISVTGITFRNTNTMSTGPVAQVDLADVTFTDNVVEGFGLGFGAQTATGNLSLVGNQSINCAIGILTTGPDAPPGTLNLQDNEVSGSTGQQSQSTAGATTPISVSVTGNTFRNNNIALGSPFALVFTGTGLVDGNLFLDNTTVNQVGGMGILVVGEATVTNNIFSGNRNTSGVGGGALGGSIDGTLTVTNNTLVGNSTTLGSGGGAFFFLFGNDDTLNFYNNIIFGNTAGANGDDIFANDDVDGDNQGATLNIFNNDFTEFYSTCANTGGCVPNISGLAPDTNLHVDPLLVDPANGNFNLSPGSPALGFGDPIAPGIPAVDFVGNPLNNPPDLGALQGLANLAVNPAALNFGTVAISETGSLDLTISNDGAGPLDVFGLVLSDEVNYSIDVNGGANPCGSLSFTLNSGESCTVTIEFSPTVNGTLNATLTISSSDPDAPSLVVPLSGVGQLFDLSGGGCSLGMALPSSGIYLALALLPALLYGLRRFKI